MEKAQNEEKEKKIQKVGFLLLLSDFSFFARYLFFQCL